MNFELVDSGPGFLSENFNNVFEPYFTTKAHGSGLGLSIVSKIVHEHKGDIIFSNDENSLGAKINFSLSKNL